MSNFGQGLPPGSGPRAGNTGAQVSSIQSTELLYVHHTAPCASWHLSDALFAGLLSSMAPCCLPLAAIHDPTNLQTLAHSLLSVCCPL
jgi:hypothetical protein